VYIDEAHDYFDESMEHLFNQAHKYVVGMLVAHQNLDQFERKLRATVMASTSIKLAGGLSAKDASALAKEMGCTPEFLHRMRKYQGYTEFACFVRHYTPRPIPLTVPFGQMEQQPKVHPAVLEDLIRRNRARYCTEAQGQQPPPEPPKAHEPAGFRVGEPEIL